MSGTSGDRKDIENISKNFQDKAGEKVNDKWEPLLCPGSSYWIPFNDIEDEGVWRNSYTSQIQEKNDWGGKEPNGMKTENCAIIVTTWEPPLQCTIGILNS